jgi:hypothetical protein
MYYSKKKVSIGSSKTRYLSVKIDLCPSYSSPRCGFLPNIEPSPFQGERSPSPPLLFTPIGIPATGTRLVPYEPRQPGQPGGRSRGGGGRGTTAPPEPAPPSSHSEIRQNISELGGIQDIKHLIMVSSPLLVFFKTFLIF